jgi:hypothetical protein
MSWGRGPERPADHDDAHGRRPSIGGVRIPLPAILAFLLFDLILVIGVVLFIVLR